MTDIIKTLTERLDAESVSACEYIKNTLTRRELLEQLAEEANELGKAALKCVRAEGLSKNPTPITADDAIDNLIEELYDILDVCAALGLEKEAEQSERKPGQKWCRWAKRVANE